jgi:hypothetical protein
MQKPYRPSGPQNLRWRCMDCGASFQNKTQREKLNMHCSVQYAGKCVGQHIGLHHGFQAVTPRNQANIASLTRYPHEAKRQFELDILEFDQ